jgi:hypothetical protein
VNTRSPVTLIFEFCLQGLSDNFADLKWRPTLLGKPRAGDPCVGTTAAAGEEVCNIRGRHYNKDMSPHVSGCYCYFYMNPGFFRPNLTIRMVQCGIPNVWQYPCILVVSILRCTFYSYLYLQMGQTIACTTEPILNLNLSSRKDSV